MKPKSLLVALLILSFSFAIAQTTPFKKGVGFSQAFESGSSIYDIHFQHYTRQDFIDIKKLGIDQVRLPIYLSNMLDENGEMEPIFFHLLDQYVDWAEAEEINLILTNMQGYNYGDLTVENDFINVWTQMAEHYKNRSELIYYELANEPSGISDEDWGRIQGNIIDSIRTIDTTHTILVTPAMWGGLEHLQYLPEYEDDNLIYVFHFYAPLLYTHQGANHTGYGDFTNVPFPYNEAEMPEMPANFAGTFDEAMYNAYKDEATEQMIRDEIAKAAKFKSERNVPLWCGEFGTDNRYSAPEGRALWYKTLRTALEENDISWSILGYTRYWGLFEYGSNKLFEHDLDVSILEAMGLNVPTQSTYIPQHETEEQLIFDDYLTDDLFHSWRYPEGGEAHFYSEETPYEGKFCCAFKDRPLWSMFSLDYLPTKDFSQLVAENYVLDFWIRGNTPGASMAISFVDSKTEDENDHAFAKIHTINEELAPWDMQWHHVQLPLVNFVDKGTWEDGTYFEPNGTFDWSKIHRIQLLAEYQALEGIGFWFDNIKISKAIVTEPVMVTFQVDMTNETVSTAGVFLRGNFNDWGSNDPLQNNANIYSKTLEFEAGTDVEYKFVNGENWESNIPNTCVVGEYNNRFFTVPAKDTSINVVCFNSCEACTPTSIENRYNNEISVFPNPTNNYVEITGLPNNSKVKIDIYNTNKQLVKTLFAENKSSVKINLTSVANGIYFIKVKGDSVNKTMKIVKKG